MGRGPARPQPTQNGPGQASLSKQNNNNNNFHINLKNMKKISNILKNKKSIKNNFVII